MKKLILCMVMLFSFGALAEDLVAQIEPKIVQYLPEDLLEYQYSGFVQFGGDLGYGLRYEKLYELEHYADIYVWPKKPSTRELSHEQLVNSYSKLALSEIFYAELQGQYKSVKVLDQFIVEDDLGKKTAFTKMSFLRQNLDTVSYLAITESEGKIIKVRISLANNSLNQSREDLQDFILKIFTEIRNNIAYS